MPEDAFPNDLERFGTVPDPVPVRGDGRLADEIAAGGDVTQHVVEIEDGDPLCGAAVAEDAPLYPFRGRRELIVRGMDDRCEDCVAALQSEVAIRA